MIRRLLSKCRYHTMTAEDYLFNQRDSSIARTLHKKDLNVLEDSNQGPPNVTDLVTLVGVPRGRYIEAIRDFDSFRVQVNTLKPDLIFVDVDPSDYIARQRFASHKCALNKVEDYEKDGIECIDPIKPITWEQAVVNLLTMDMIRQNKTPDQLDMRKGFYSYNYKELQDQNAKKQLTQPFVKAIGNYILGGQRSGYDYIDKVMYTALMGKQKVILGGMPQTLRRLILGNSLTIHQMRDIFRFILQTNKQLSTPLPLKQATISFLPHIFQLPKDLYMTAILKESFQAAMQIIATVGIQHWRPIQQYWIGAPHGINYHQATHIPDRLQGQTDEDLIQKQAIMEVLFETRQWGKNYLSNPFPYLTEDITKVSKWQLSQLKSLFKKHYAKYKLFKDKQSKQIASVPQTPQLENKHQQQLSRILEKMAKGPQLNRYKITPEGSQPNRLNSDTSSSQ